MVRIYIFLIILSSTGILRAQLSKTFSINFETNAYQLTSNHRHFIDSIITTLPNIPEAYIIEVKGHTDNKGSLELNNALSKNRAQTILNFLKSKNFKTTDTSYHFYAYNSPLTQNTEDKLWKNRRVEVNLYARKLDMVKILGINNFTPKNYKFIEDVGGQVTYDSTKIVIAPNSFVHKNGSEVTGEIDINYIEYRTPADFLLSGIPMSIKNGNDMSHFNSGGMFDLTAYQNGEQLLLKKDKDKTVFITFPLSNLVNQNFYQFDTTLNQWNNNAPAITSMHGNVLFPFNTNINQDSVALKDYQNFCKCVPDGDTCAYVAYMLKKLVYFATHEEPIRYNYPYKFIKNNLVDFKSPLYVINFNPNEHTFTITPKNNNSRLGSFTNYVWKYRSNDPKNQLEKNYSNGFSFVKVTNRNGSKFKLRIESEIIRVTGEPINFKEDNNYKKPFLSFIHGNKEKALEAKLKKTNKTNYKTYKSYTQEIDRQEAKLETQLREKDEMYSGNINNTYCSDSIDCLGYFYRQYLYTSDEKELVNLVHFNLHKDKLIKKLKTLPSPFTCNDAKRILIKKDSIERSLVAKRDSALNLAKLTFAKFGINATGVYNADQVKNINSPEEIVANYKDQANRPLKIISIYLSIKGLNGIINYNGYMNYGPYKFVYSKADPAMLIAVDENEKSYYCTPTEFAAFINAKQDKTVSFVLKPISNVQSSLNLNKIVSR